MIPVVVLLSIVSKNCANFFSSGSMATGPKFYAINLSISIENQNVLVYNENITKTFWLNGG